MADKKPDPAGQAAPAYALVVRQPFGDYQRGDKITDPQKVADILAGENESHVVKTAA
ncbi:hypothetical protein JFK97_06810 [Chromobacterium phragmitis]|uniref:hypothetical protein n=1 Tax=Chromobacterium amazonense TaxID=1382803 RepID=UPI0021B7C91D|nr:hypothetical protein [Chromobacterium amazonense]MBM2884098.1 hypothetical protein [Chromobacterium amazonense]